MYTSLTIALVGILLLNPLQTEASEFTCFSSSGGFCRYIGKISRNYINKEPRILLYFEDAIDTSLPGTVGIDNVTKPLAATLKYTESNDKFWTSVYATLLAAQLSDRQVTVQFVDSESNYLVIDKIWVD